MTDGTDKTTAASYETAIREAARAAATANAPYGFTSHERVVLAHLTQGHTTRQIANALLISENTASSYVANILTKIGDFNDARAAAVTFAPAAALLLGTHLNASVQPTGFESNLVRADNLRSRDFPWLQGPKQHVVSNPVSAQQRPSIVQIEAAKLRLVTDRRLGKTSPEWLKRVAQGLPAQPQEAAATPTTSTS